LIALWAHILGSALFRLLPREWWYRLSDVLVPVVLLGWQGQVSRATGNLRRVLGPDLTEREVDRRTRAIFRNYARYMIDLLWLPDATVPERERALTIRGWDHIPAALARGRGLIIVTGHLGNWDLPASVLAGRGYVTNVIVETLEPPAWNERVQALRERAGVRAIPMETGVRDLYAALRRNEVVAVVFDRPLTVGGVEVTFFGEQTRVPEGVARLALRTGAAVIGAVGVRRGSRFVAEVSVPFEVAVSGDRQRDVELLTQQIVDWFERWVRQYPDQWFMFRNFWPSVASSEGNETATPTR
jgi:phosphatidylinositol dimannoside acyltransferase